MKGIVMKKKIGRREFIEKTSAGIATAAILSEIEIEAADKNSMPKRKFGQTGIEVPIIAFGCGSRFMTYGDEDALKILNQAIDLGINYLDTAQMYGKGQSEIRVGKVMKTRRKDVILATKISPAYRTRDEALREVEASLKRLQTDKVDVLHIHDVKQMDDLKRIEAPDGVLKAVYELKDQKVTRFIGMTSHTDGATMKAAIERHNLDCVQIALNPTRINEFESLALPAANKKGIGVLLMKVSARGELIGSGPGHADMESLFRYGLSLPVSTVVVSMEKPEHMLHNVKYVKNYKPMTAKEMDQLAAKLAPRSASLEHFFHHHDDAHWA
jgi:uncharacterized protein